MAKDVSKMDTKQNDGKAEKGKANEVQRFVPGMMTCRANGCGAKLMVRSTSKTPLGDGRILIERAVKCQGPCRHTYTLTETVTVRR